MKTRLITDFDGPLMDVSGRYYHVYQICLERSRLNNQKINRLSKSKFWQLKRDMVPEEQIGLISGLDELSAKSFAKMRRDTVHDLIYFQYDQIIPGSLEALERIQRLGVDLALMTMRRQRELELAFEKYDLNRFFTPERSYHLGDDFIKTTDVQDKPKLMDRAQLELPPVENTWMVGDTEADIAAAKKHRIKSIGVLSGIRSKAQLEKFQPDYVVDNLAQAVDLIADYT
jgi:phosphoglycolate phosphatase-like HAD superfamily hydrolase